MHSAKLARALASSRIGATVQVAWSPAPYRVRHAIDQDGRPLLLCQAGGLLDAVLRADDDVAVVLAVAGRARRVWIAGWACALSGLAQHAAALDFATANPLSDLLEVGRRFVLYRIDLAEIRLESHDRMIEICIDDYVSAVSEPVT